MDSERRMMKTPISGDVHKESPSCPFAGCIPVVESLSTRPTPPTCKHGKTAQEECGECHGGFDNASPMIVARPTPTIELQYTNRRGTGQAPQDDREAISAKVHEQWMQSKRDKGISSRKSESGEELMIPYERLSEAAKDLDRGSVDAVLKAMAALGASPVSQDDRVLKINAKLAEYDAAEAEADAGTQARARCNHDEYDLCDSCTPEAFDPPAAQAKPSVNGALWLCYHALKQVEWGMPRDMCPYCLEFERLGHDKDCMIGNGLKAMAEATAQAKEKP